MRRFDVYRGVRTSWQVVRLFAPRTRVRFFGFGIGRLWIGGMWECREPEPEGLSVDLADCPRCGRFRGHGHVCPPIHKG